MLTLRTQRRSHFADTFNCTSIKDDEAICMQLLAKIRDYHGIYTMSRNGLAACCRELPVTCNISRSFMRTPDTHLHPHSSTAPIKINQSVHSRLIINLLTARSKYNNDRTTNLFSNKLAFNAASLILKGARRRRRKIICHRRWLPALVLIASSTFLNMAGLC